MTSTQAPGSSTGIPQQLHLEPITPIFGRVLNFFGKAVKVKDDQGAILFVKPETITQQLLDHRNVSKDTAKLITKRIIEIADPVTTQPLSIRKLNAIFRAFREDTSTSKIETDQEIIDEIEKIKLELDTISPIAFDQSLSEIAAYLQPGDLLVRKYHESHDNLICTLQHFFSRNGYREAYKCSHLAVYLGDIDGKKWIAEASMPHEGEAEIRRIELDDPRFSPRPMNQYIIIRNNDPEEAAKMGRLAQNYVLKMNPGQELGTEDYEGGARYTFFEAARSLWHLPNLGPYGRHRVLKYYADYKNKIPFEYLGKERKFFCSHFALVMESLAEMSKSADFQEFISKHEVPALYDANKTGIALKISKLWYSIRKGLWARKLAFFHKNEIKNTVHTHLDPLRSSPQDTVVYMMEDPKHYTIVGQIIRQSDYPNVVAAKPGQL